MQLSWAAEITKTTQDAVTKTATNFCESSPAGMARVAVRGLAASICASARRLKAMAAERADTMHKAIQPSCATEGIPPAASMAAHRANGRAKTECSHLIISSVIPMLLRIRKDYSSSQHSARKTSLNSSKCDKVEKFELCFQLSTY